MIKHEILVVEETHQSNPRSSYTQWNPGQLQWKAEKETSQEKNLQVLMHSARQMVTTNVWKKKNYWCHSIAYDIFGCKALIMFYIKTTYTCESKLLFLQSHADIPSKVQIYIDKSIYLMGEKRFLHHRLFIKI